MEKKTDLRIERTYLFLHNAFTQLLEEKRFEDFTVNELCERAMIRRTTFYKHFADKYEYFTFYVKEICASFQDQLPPDVHTDNINAYFIHMCRELLRFVTKHDTLVGNVLNSNMYTVLFDTLADQITQDVLQVLRRMPSASHMTASQMEGTAAFYSGGLLTTLRMFLKRGDPIEEDQFIEIVSSFMN